jgi:hypothetical protein
MLENSKWYNLCTSGPEIIFMKLLIK